LRKTDHPNRRAKPFGWPDSDRRDLAGFQINADGAVEKIGEHDQAIFLVHGDDAGRLPRKGPFANPDLLSHGLRVGRCGDDSLSFPTPQGIDERGIQSARLMTVADRGPNPIGGEQDAPRLAILRNLDEDVARKRAGAGLGETAAQDARFCA
jgi:hypothetical protein